MAEPERDHAVRTGVIALVGVGLAVGLLVSGGVLVVTQVLGLGQSGSSSAAPAGGGASMYLPTPSPTPSDTAPQLTLAPQPGPGEGVATSAPALPQASPSLAQGITLTASPTAASAMELITLQGTYLGGDGAQLQVERLTGDTWTAFPVSTTVDPGGAYLTKVRTAQVGATQFRVRDVATGATSDEVTVTIS